MDKSTEFALSLLPSNVCMEIKYVFCGLAGPLVNLWRVEQSIDHVVPFIISHRIENDGADPSMEQIKNRLDKLPWEKFIYRFSFDCIKELQCMGKNSFMTSVLSPTTASTVRIVTEMNGDSGGALLSMTESMAVQVQEDAPILALVG